MLIHLPRTAGTSITNTLYGRMAATERWLTETLGRPIAFTRQNASPREDYRSYYTSRMRDEIARIYSDDVATLGYSF